MDAVKKCFMIPSLFLEKIAMIIIFLVCCITLVNGITRALFSTPIYGTLEIVQYSVFLAMCLALPSCTMNEGHTRVSLVIDSLPFVGKKILMTLTSLFSLVMFSMVSWSMFGTVMKTFESGRTTDIFKVPFYIIQGILMVAIAVLALILVFKTIASILAKKPEEIKIEEIEL